MGGPAESQRLEVPLGERGYFIDVGPGLLADGVERLTGQLRLLHAVVVTDSNVAPLYGEPLSAALGERIPTQLLVVPAGEASKSPQHLQALWEGLLAAGADRSTAVLAVGGGVVGDLAGFAAASFARGLTFVQVPTTLLAQVDSSVGGKVGINLPHAKNMVGAFWQPAYVLIDIQVLQTLPDREYRAGLAEVVKYGVIADAPFLDLLEQHQDAVGARDPDLLGQIVCRCCQIKARVVAADERELSGQRAILNYGHTFAHALEAVTGYATYLHGEAVALGMVCASRLAERLQLVGPGFADRQQTLLAAWGLPTRWPPADPDALLASMRQDKKSVQGQLRLILPTAWGEVASFQGIDELLIREVLADAS